MLLLPSPGHKTAVTVSTTDLLLWMGDLLKGPKKKLQNSDAYVVPPPLYKKAITHLPPVSGHLRGHVSTV